MSGIVFQYVRDNVAEAYFISSAIMEPAFLRDYRL
jgi:hypothetical protein